MVFQPLKMFSTTAQQPCATPTFNSSEHISEMNCIKAMLADLQKQQQNISVIVNHLSNKIKTQDMSCLNHSSFYPYMGPYDTGQCFNKLQQV